ncbi:hypothetical protein H1R20_g10934, partial [Candolleomyces eurysporus]
MPQLNPSRPYTIQNVDFNSCLEMTVRPINKPTSARAWKDSDKQRWRFVLAPGSEDEYYIYNVAQKTYLGILSEKDRRLVSKSRFNASKWLLYPVKSSRNKHTFEIVLSGEETDTCLQLGEFGNPYIADRDDSEAQHWRVFSGNPPSPFPTHPVTLPPGYYRIRNLDGRSILSLPDGDADVPGEFPSAHIAEQDSDNDHQRWFVKPKVDDGSLYSIQSSTNHGDFLGVDSTQLVKFGSIRGLPYEFFWELQSVGGFGYTLHVKSVQGTLSPGFNVPVDLDSLGHGKVVLLPNNNNHSQVWLFEQWDKIPAGISSSSSDNIVSYSAGRGSSKVLGTNGWYNICSYTRPTYYLHLYGYYGAPHLYPVDASYLKTYGSFHFVYKGDLFQIKDRYSSPYYATLPSGSSYLGTSTNQTDAVWWYLKYEKSKEAYYICLHEPSKKKGDVVQVLGNNPTAQSGNAFYNVPIVALDANNTNQLWVIQ